MEKPAAELKNPYILVQPWVVQFRVHTVLKQAIQVAWLESNSLVDYNYIINNGNTTEWSPIRLIFVID